MAIMANVFWIATDLLERINARLVRHCRFQRIERVDSFQRKLVVLYNEQSRYFAKTLSVKWIEGILGLHAEGRSASAMDQDVVADRRCLYFDKAAESEHALTLSAPMRRVMNEVLRIQALCRSHLPRDTAKAVVGCTANAVINQLDGGKYLKRSMSGCGLGQFVFDLKFFGTATHSLLDDDAKWILISNKITDEAVRQHQESGKGHFTLKTKEEYAEAIDEALRCDPQFNLNEKDVDEDDTKSRDHSNSP